ncbi:MAG: DUF4911 domain-containing protein [Pseudomonadota bacterium]
MDGTGIGVDRGPEFMTHWRLQIDPQRVHYLKYILEGYDNTATVSTLDHQLGIVDLCIAPGSEALVRELLSSMKNAIGLKRIETKGSKATSKTEY